jgi:hypothetical protein
MGYTSEFSGIITLNKKLDADTAEFLKKFNQTRRMGRKGLDPKYGIEGEFYVDGKGDFGQDNDPSIIDHNKPPSTQPGLWCQWVPTEDLSGIEWDGGEKFYESKAWMEYIIDKILAPKGYIANGTIEVQGESLEDHWWLVVKENKVTSRNTTEIQEALSSAEERVRLLETPPEDLPLLINQVWVDPENEILFNRLLKSQSEHNRALELLETVLKNPIDKTLKAQITKYLKKGGDKVCKPKR